jgi:hypothetical protein
MNLSTTRRHHFGRQVAKGHLRIEAVAEFGGEQLLHGLVACIFLADIGAEADAFLGHVAGAGIGGHDQDDIAEIDRLAMVIGQAAIIHDLQQDVEQVRMGLSRFRRATARNAGSGRPHRSADPPWSKPT